MSENKMCNYCNKLTADEIVKGDIFCKECGHQRDMAEPPMNQRYVVGKKKEWWQKEYWKSWWYISIWLLVCYVLLPRLPSGSFRKAVYLGIGLLIIGYVYVAIRKRVKQRGSKCSSK